MTCFNCTLMHSFLAKRALSDLLLDEDGMLFQLPEFDLGPRSLLGNFHAGSLGGLEFHLRRLSIENLALGLRKLRSQLLFRCCKTRKWRCLFQRAESPHSPFNSTWLCPAVAKPHPMPA